MRWNLQSEDFKTESIEKTTLQKYVPKRDNGVNDFKLLMNDPVETELFQIISKLYSAKLMPINMIGNNIQDMKNLSFKISVYHRRELKESFCIGTESLYKKSKAK